MTIKLLIVMKLADRNLKYHIYPITLLKEIDEIIIIRDRKGPEIQKVKYYCPPKWTLNFPILALFFKFLLIVYLSIKEKPALIHSYLLFPYGILVFLAGKLTRRKVGVSLIAGPVELYMLFGGSPIKKYAYNRPLPKISGIKKILLYITKKMDVITTTGNFTKIFLIKNGVPKNKIFIQFHAVDNKFKPSDTEKIYDVIYVGRLVKVKHVETLIRAIAKCKEFMPSIRVAIVGDGPEGNILRELSKKLGLTENIHFMGYQHDVWNWYNKARISILVSEREGFPFSVVESLSCGVPVVASNCGDIRDVLIDGYNGNIIDDYYNHSLFACAILELLENHKKLAIYSKNALETAKKLTEEKVTFVWKKIIGRILDFEDKRRSFK